MLDLFTLKPDAFGLDISDATLKIAKLQKRGKRYQLASFGKMSIEPGIVEKGEVKDEKALGEAIQKSLEHVSGKKLQTTYAVASLPEEKAFLEVIQMPKMKEEELKRAVYFEAENYIPLSIEDVYLDFQAIPPVYNHLDHIDVLIAALPKNFIDSYVFCFKKAGLRPQALEIESLAIARALIKNGVSPHPLLLVDLGANKTSFMIFSGYSLRFTRSVPLSAQDFTQAIAKELNISPQEAETLKVKFGLEKKYQLKIKNGTEREVAAGRVFKILSSLLNNLTEEIEKSLDYYLSHATHEHLPPNGRQINKVLLCGGGANLKGLPEFLSLALKKPVELGNPWINILKPPLREIPQLTYEESLSFTTALGLALRGIGKEQYD